MSKQTVHVACSISASVLARVVVVVVVVVVLAGAVSASGQVHEIIVEVENRPLEDHFPLQIGSAIHFHDHYTMGASTRSESTQHGQKTPRAAQRVLEDERSTVYGLLRHVPKLSCERESNFHNPNHLRVSTAAICGG